MKKLLLLGLLMATTVSARTSKSDADTLTIAMTGDIMMGTTFPTVQLPANDGRDIFRDTKAITRQASIAVGNLEGAVCDSGQSTKGNGPNSYSFRMPTRFAPLLKDAERIFSRAAAQQSSLPYPAAGSIFTSASRCKIFWCAPSI